MGAEAEETDLFRRLRFCGPVLHLVRQVGTIADPVHEEQVDVIRLHALQRKVQHAVHALGRMLAAGLGDEKYLFARVGIPFEEEADALLAVAVVVSVGGVPIGHAEIQGALENELVGGDVKMPPSPSMETWTPVFPNGRSGTVGGAPAGLEAGAV